MATSVSVTDPARPYGGWRQQHDKDAACIQAAADRLSPLLARQDAVRNDPDAPAACLAGRLPGGGRTQRPRGRGLMKICLGSRPGRGCSGRGSAAGARAPNRASYWAVRSACSAASRLGSASRRITALEQALYLLALRHPHREAPRRRRGSSRSKGHGKFLVAEELGQELADVGGVGAR